MKLKFATILMVFFGTVSAWASADCTGTDLEREKCLSKTYLDAMAAEKGAHVVDGGVIVRPLFEGPGAHPKVSDTVTVGYYLTDREGKLIETTITEDELATFPLDKLIACWKTAIPRMSVGSLYKITCPSDTAYGDRGAGTEIKGGAALTFRIQLYGIVAK